MIELRPYQRECIEAVLTEWRKGVTRQLVSLPTGCGKTIIFAALAKELNTHTLIVAHREELIRQAVDKIRMVWPEADAGVVMAEENDYTRQVVVASIQTASRPARLERLKTQDYRLLIIDEAHHAAAETYRRVAAELGFMEDDRDKLLLGVTATAMRGDGVALGTVFQKITFERSIAAMIKAGYLCDLRGIRVATRTSLNGVAVRGGDFAEGQLEAAINTEERNRIVVEAYLDHAAPRKAIAFTAGVRHAKDLAEEFRRAGLAAEAVYGAMPAEDRRKLIEAFHAGKLHVLTNCMILTEGFDCPSVEALLMARPTKSRTLYIQMVGRGTRLYPGKTECLVIDFCDNHHDVCTLGTLAGKPLDGLRNGQSLREAVMEEEAERTGKLLRPAGEIVTEEFDLMQRSQFRWVAVGEHWRLNLGNGIAVWLKHLGNGQYDTGITRDNQLIQKLSATPLPLGYAQGVAEDWARKNANTTLVDKTAPWRQLPATEKQLAALRKWGVTPPPGITRGEACDMLDDLWARREAYLNSPATHKQIYALKKLGFDVKPGLTQRDARKLFEQARRRA